MKSPRPLPICTDRRSHRQPGPCLAAAGGHRRAFTLVEVLIVALLIGLIMLVAYKVFFTQAGMVSQQLEYLKVNEHFRAITAHLNNDIREATRIELPRPIPAEDAFNKPTKPGPVIHLFKQVLAPEVHPADGQEMQTVEVIYELVDHENPHVKDVPRYKLLRHEITRKKTEILSKTKTTLSDSLAAFVAFSTIRKPPAPRSLNTSGDSLLTWFPSFQNGTGPDLIHVTITVERLRTTAAHKEVYDISMTTSICRRGKEVFANP